MRARELEPNDIRELVSRHSQLGSKHALYPGNDYTILANFLQPGPDRFPGARSTHREPPEPFVVAYDLSSGSTSATSRLNPEGMKWFKQQQDLAALRPQLVFVRGFPDAKWLRVLSATYGVDPAVYQRHLVLPTLSAVDHMHHFYTNPPLPSSSGRIFSLMVTTICSNETANTSALAEDVEDLRRKGSAELLRYHLDLKKNGAVGDSIVRQYSVLSRKIQVIEQWVSIYISRVADSWNVVVWMDNARDLSQGISGPWCPERGTTAWKTYMLPIIQHRDCLAFHSDVHSTADTSATAQTWEANQNACLLPFQFGKFLKRDILAHDALYALSDVFRLSAASEGQFLNLMDRQIEHELEISRNSTPKNSSILNLRYLARLLEDHLTKLTEMVLLLESQDHLGWPRAAPGSDHRVEADRMRKLLLGDFSHLRHKAERLRENCRGGVQSLAHTSSLQESERAMANAQRVGRLTLLATIFVPLSCTCSAFGMNFAVFGQGDLNIWIFFPTAAGVMLISFLIWYTAKPGTRQRGRCSAFTSGNPDHSCG
ncbi:uncharacterized protein DNG_06117 [Cephalotrichum gorgonifer]|uniref:CorA domain-containing protein n=1 Tax=Cephalotrichum gorgonifer TaxID=2041049 RepID=A0AAE8SWB3_9PEZI|nr:uncharacterized protein DNG_06117 [Cephalotrichum gorgonifer]